MCEFCLIFIYFFFNDTATTEIYTLSLHDALPIYSAAADVGIARDHRDRSVLADMRRGARISTNIEPEARRHTARIARLRRRLVVLGVLDRLQRFDHADRIEGDAVGGLGALLGGVLQTQVDRIDLELQRQDIERRLDGPRRDRRTRRAIGRDLGPVADDVEAHDV